MIGIKDLNKTYDRRHKNANRVLRDVSLTLPDRGFVCILGPSGCGKTSFLNAVGGLDNFDSGTITVGDRTLTRSGSHEFEEVRNRSFGYIFQNYYLLEEHSAAYNIYLGLHSLDLSHEEKLDCVFDALGAVDMDRFALRRVGELSGGQQQRIAIARALARRPRVIFADEPTGNLDEANTRNICSLLRQASKESLVIMVTHEERIAKFFADRIITLDGGVISGDSESWQRTALNTELDSVIYTDGLEGCESDGEMAKLRIFSETGASPVELTVAVLSDSIVLKISDPRAISLGTKDELPIVIDGGRPELTIDVFDKPEVGGSLFSDDAPGVTKAGRGVTLPVMLREAWQLKHEKGFRRAGLKVFLCLLTVLTLLVVGDFVFLSRIDPEDFITTDSHLLFLTIDQGKKLDPEMSAADKANAFIHALNESGLDFDFVPVSSVRAQYYASVFHQLGYVPLSLPTSFSYVPVTRLDESTLISGRMPEDNYEVVLDRRVIDAMLKEDNGIIPNTIVDPSYFLGAELSLEGRNARVTVVGISDSGEMSVYVNRSVLLTVRRDGNIRAISLSEFKEMVTGERYSDMTLADDECIVNYSVAGAGYRMQIGGTFSVANFRRYRIKDAVRLPETEALVVLNDEQISELMVSGTVPYSVYLYCADKDEVRRFINKKVREDNDGTISVRVSDPYQSQYNDYSRAVEIRANARSIVTGTVLAVCLLMLWLLCRTQAEGRIRMLAVYRLLGIPKRKLHMIFLFEGVFSALTAIIPSALLTWGAVAFINSHTEAGLSIMLTWQAVAVTGVGILAYYLLTTILPLFSLLRLPPSQLAAKYDL